MRIIDEGYILDVDKADMARRCCIGTSLRRLSSGKILASFRRGSDKDSSDGTGTVAESTDNGKTWRIATRAFDPVVDGIGGEIRVAELAELDDGTVLAFVLWVDRSSGGPLYDDETDTLLPTKVALARSSDQGRTWGPYELLGTGEYRGAALSGPVVRIPGRGWLVPFEDFQPGTGTHSANALFSRDGTSVDTLAQVAKDPDDVLNFWDERLAFCPKTGRLVGTFWTFNRKTEQQQPIHMAWGDPDTLTWEQPFSTGIQGQITQLLPLPDGRLLAFYVRRRPPGSMRLIISQDSGKTWDYDSEIAIWDRVSVDGRATDGQSGYAQVWQDIMYWTFGHPTGVVLDDGTLLLAYYAGLDNTCLSIRWAHVAL